MDQQTSPTQTDFPVTIAGKQYTLAFPMEAYWAYHDATGIDLLAPDPRVLKPGLTAADVAAIAREIQAEYLKKPYRQRQKDSCDLLWAGLQLHHQDLTREDVEKMVGGLSAHDYQQLEVATIQAHRASLFGPQEDEADGDAEGVSEKSPLAPLSPVN